MLVPLSWLREFVHVDADADAIAERLSLTGLAVEQVIRSVPATGVVVGEVLSFREHPNADSLMLVKVTDGTTEHDIVCGARNYADRDRVPLALPGARLPNGMDIGAREVRGEPSNGMLCSARELGLGEDHTGILLLDADAPLGADLAKTLGLDEVVLDIDITPNRPDALSIVGVAREVAAVCGGTLRVPETNAATSGAPAAEAITIEIKDRAGCPRYVGRVIRGVAHGRSPWWMRRRLYAAGMRPISTIVDITNYVMLERGQPLHAFDLSTVRGASIIVRKAKKGERITTLDGTERALERDDVMICDAEGPVAIGGVMGGAETEVTDATTDVLLEAAHFDPVRIARTARRLGLRSEASYRFERGADPEAPTVAAERACALLAELAGGAVAPGVVDVIAKPIKRKAIRLRAARTATIAGVEVPVADMARMLTSLGCDVTATTRTSLRAVPPSWRPDLAIEDDMIEEVARLYGYDRIPALLPTGGRTGGLTPRQRRIERLRDVLAGTGLNEALTLSLLPPDLGDRLGLPADHPWRATLELANPLSAEESVLRPSLIPGLLLAARANVARGVTPVRLFEIGVTFHPGGEEGRTEVTRAAFVLHGDRDTTWHGAAGDVLDFTDGAGILEAVGHALGVELTLRAVEPRAPLHPGRIADIVTSDRPIGLVAEVHPRTARDLELDGRVVVGEFEIEPIVSAEPIQRAPEIPRFPALMRDIAVVVPDGTEAATVRGTLASAGGPALASVHLFDLYRGDPIPAGHRSLAFALAFRDPQGTLTDADAEGPMAAITAAVTGKGWTVRD